MGRLLCNFYRIHPPSGLPCIWLGVAHPLAPASSTPHDRHTLPASTQHQDQGRSSSAHKQVAIASLSRTLGAGPVGVHSVHSGALRAAASAVAHSLHAPGQPNGLKQWTYTPSACITSLRIKQACVIPFHTAAIILKLELIHRPTHRPTHPPTHTLDLHKQRHSPHGTCTPVSSKSIPCRDMHMASLNPTHACSNWNHAVAVHGCRAILQATTRHWLG